MPELLNCLLDNADKYATGGTVLMSCYADADGTYAISVSNEGPVIPAEDAERLKKNRKKFGYLFGFH